jgi:tRNA (adenine22-N1)-methyltransferase
MKLTPRLQTIADLIEPGSVIGDVGTDHGYLPIYLIEKGICSSAIATDINAGPAENARQAVRGAGLLENIDIRLGGGLLPYSVGEVDTVIIAGMGGLLIRDILIERPEMTQSVKRFILQPMVAQDELRRWLCQNHFKITNEMLSVEGQRIYEVMVVEHGHMTIDNELDYELGLYLIKENDPLSVFFLEKKVKQTKEIIAGLKSSKKESAQAKVPALENKLRGLEARLKCL